MTQDSICYVTPEWDPVTRGGIGRAVRELASRDEQAIVLLDRRRSEIEAARASLPAGVSLFGVDECAESTIGSFAFRSESYARSYRIWRALSSLCDRYSVSRIEFVDYDGPGYVAIKALRLGLSPQLPPMSVRLHGTMERILIGDGRRLFRLEDKQRARMERYALTHANVIVAPSIGVLDEYMDGGLIERSRKREIRVDPPHMAVPGVKADWSQLDARFRIGFLGKLQPVKGPITLIQAALVLLDRDDPVDVEVHLVGGDQQGWYADSHRRELLNQIPARYRSRFTFHGVLPVEAAHRVLANCHAAALPSRSETYGLAAREAAAIGLPVALSDLPAFRSGFDEATAAVEYFPVDDALALAQVLERWAELQSSESWPPAFEPHLPYSSAPIVAGGASLGPERLHVEEVISESKKNQPLVSVVIPFFEMQDYVDACLASVEADPYPFVECLIVDDGSTSTAALAKLDSLRHSFAEEGRHRILQQRNKGLGSARNAGIRAAQGELILPLDPDDLIVSGYLDMAVTALERVPELSYVVGISSLFDDGRSPAEEQDWVVPYDPSRGMLMYENGAGTAAAVFRKSHLEGFPYREDLPAYEDWDLYLRLAAAGRFGESLPTVTHRYRQRVSGLAQLAHRHHDRLVAEIVSPHLNGDETGALDALEIYMESESRLRGLGEARSSRNAKVLRWVERVYRRCVKGAMRDWLGEEHRDKLAATVRRLLRGR